MPAIYAALTDMEERFAVSELIQLTDDAGTGAVDTVRMGQALASASALVEGYVAAIYDLDPTQPVPLLLIDATCDIARFRLYRTTPPDDVVARNGHAVRMLEGIRAGRIKLDDGVPVLTARPDRVLISEGRQHMTRHDLRSY